MKAHQTIPNAFFDVAGALLFDSAGRLYESHIKRTLFHAVPLFYGGKIIKAPTFTTLALLVAKH